MSDEAIELWTARLRALAPELDEPTAHGFVRQVYDAARSDLDEEALEADFEREE
ncbi:hypothetical protein [Streptomyces sp. AJS327]|uniref:hypothetical protein n=1 Tax=Streptomyces sp. AJS327 TaxID=2545265 RepID=UPI0015DEA1DE|nr:hypothetical protein [Streptomyces sp. AJS327]